MRTIYPLIKSGWGDCEELRYSLRSLEKFADWDLDVVIIGYLPDWLKKVTHVEFQDGGRGGVSANVAYKIDLLRRRFQDDEFVWMNDDHYLLKKTNIKELKRGRYLANLKGVPTPVTPKKWRKGVYRPTKWQMRVFNTRDRCKELGLPEYNPALHIPAVYYRDVMKEAFNSFDLYSGAMLFSVAHFNLSVGMKAVQPMLGEDRLGLYNKASLPTNWDKYRFLNHDNVGLTDALKGKLEELFSEKSRFER